MQPSRRMSCAIMTVIISVLLLPPNAHAHGMAHAGFLTGLLHPLSGWDHLLAAIGIGLWAGQLNGSARRVLFAISLLALLSGFLLAPVLTLAQPAVILESVIAVSVLAVGIIALLRLRTPMPLAISIAGGFMLFHGCVHAMEAAPDTNLLLYAAGLGLMTATIQGLGIAISVATRAGYWQLVPRLLGMTMAFSGVWAVAGALTG